MVASEEDIIGVFDQEWMGHWWFEMGAWGITAGLLVALPVVVLLYRRADRRAAERGRHGTVVYVDELFVERVNEDRAAENSKPEAITSRLLDSFDRRDAIVHVTLESGEITSGPALRSRLGESARPGEVNVEHLGGLFLFRGRFQVLEVAVPTPGQVTESGANPNADATMKPKAVEKPAKKTITLVAELGGHPTKRRIRLTFESETKPFPTSAGCSCLGFIDGWDAIGTTLEVTPLVLLR
ncbi:hypothetical protein [Alloactinosynnema sp. L-07]|uniref:hypothetical protein n=1 Tax=Alloactinosynnema sp. L-07 TaxID=1653480 RepID=UPI00065EFA1F|nr:hypothetical protein [Alloactinosynnema sp. L-07]CRK59247.1 hypothetical protein [Alloactinosynnema sp. L-07]